MRVGQSRRRDTVERQIIDGLRRRGVSVLPLSAPGAPDLLTYYRGRWLPLEVKDPHRRQFLTEAQWLLRQRMPYCVVTSVDEAVQVVLRHGPET